MKALLICERCERSEWQHPTGNKRQQYEDAFCTRSFARWLSRETGKPVNSSVSGPILHNLDIALSTYSEAPADFKPGKRIKRVYRHNDTKLKQPRKPRIRAVPIYLVGELWFSDKSEAREFSEAMAVPILKASTSRMETI